MTRLPEAAHRSESPVAGQRCSVGACEAWYDLLCDVFESLELGRIGRVVEADVGVTSVPVTGDETGEEVLVVVVAETAASGSGLSVKKIDASSEGLLGLGRSRRTGRSFVASDRRVPRSGLRSRARRLIVVHESA